LVLEQSRNKNASNLHVVALLYRLRHTQRDVDWNRIHELIAAKLGDRSAEEVYEMVTEYHSRLDGVNEQAVARDFKALTCGIFSKQQQELASV
jgi:hypothetical protein